MDDKARQRMDRATIAFMYKINENSPRNFGTAAKLEEYRFSHDASRPEVAFSIVRKVQPGEGTDGSNWQRLGCITLQQAEIIEKTSQSDEEIIDRLYKLLILGVDTTRLAVPQTGITQDQLEFEVQKRLDAILSSNETIQKILKAGNAAGVAKEPIPEVPSGIQAGIRRSKDPKPVGTAAQRRAIAKKEVQTYRERLDQMGRTSETIPLTNTGPRVGSPRRDWMARIDQQWQNFLDKQPAGEPQATA